MIPLITSGFVKSPLNKSKIVGVLVIDENFVLDLIG
jgi:hypothetical protein